MAETEEGERRTRHVTVRKVHTFELKAHESVARSVPSIDWSAAFGPYAAKHDMVVTVRPGRKNGGGLDSSRTVITIAPQAVENSERGIRLPADAVARLAAMPSVIAEAKKAGFDDVIAFLRHSTEKA